MIFLNYFLVKIAVCVLGLAGFVVARHIHTHKKPNATPLVCPMNFDCHSVVHSDYSKFLGMPVEILGMINYAFITLSYLFFILVPSTMSPLWVGIIAIEAIVAFLFSLYLISVQLFILKKGCFWCYISSLICILIFVLTLLAYDFPSLVQSFVS